MISTIKNATLSELLSILETDKSYTKKVYDKFVELNEFGSKFVLVINHFTKKEFDKLWNQSDNDMKLKLFASNNTSSIQLEEVWNYLNINTFAYDIHPLIVKILKHHNVNEKILNAALNNKTHALEIASNYNISNHSEIYNVLIEKWSSFDDIFDALLSNGSIYWTQLAYDLDIYSYLNDMFPINKLNDKKYAIIYRFFQRDDTPYQAKKTIYTLSHDIIFLNDELKDIFLVE